jgi:hypothetical protein
MLPFLLNPCPDWLQKIHLDDGTALVAANAEQLSRGKAGLV